MNNNLDPNQYNDVLTNLVNEVATYIEDNIAVIEADTTAKIDNIESVINCTECDNDITDYINGKD